MVPLSCREKMMAKERSLREPMRWNKKEKVTRTKTMVSSLKLSRWNRKPPLR